MKTYIGTKILLAKPMTRGEYNNHHEWTTLPEDENPLDDGYLVQYDNDYISWSPKSVFETHYREISDSEKFFLIRKEED